jgi:hypothetical protein
VHTFGISVRLINNMEQTDYTNRELDMKFGTLAEKIDENHKETIEKIDILSRRNDDKHLETSAHLRELNDKVSFTNGKVKKHEKVLYGLLMSGGVVMFLGGTIIGLVVYIYQYQLGIQSTRITSLQNQISK